MIQAEVSTYLEEVKNHLHLDPGTERKVLTELYSHFEEKVTDLQEQGVSEGEATREAIASFGGARSIARLMYEAYSQGSWGEALISSQPHFIMTLLFAMHIWRYPFFLCLAFATIMLISLLGWRRGTPNWLYSWIGYSFFPLLLLSYLSLGPVSQTVTFVFSGRGTPAPLWHLFALVVFYCFTLWLVASATVKAARRDWILVSLMLLPLPVLVIWFASIAPDAGVLTDILRSIERRFTRWDTAMAYFCFTLGVATVLFIRIRQRMFKALAIIGAGIVGSAAVVQSIWGAQGFLGILLVSSCFLVFLVSPFFLHTLVGHADESRPATRS